MPRSAESRPRSRAICRTRTVAYERVTNGAHSRTPDCDGVSSRRCRHEGDLEPSRAMPRGESATGQIAFVGPRARGLARAVARAWLGSWSVWTFDSERLPHRTYCPGSSKGALCCIGPPTYELVEPRTDPSILED